MAKYEEPVFVTVAEASRRCEISIPEIQNIIQKLPKESTRKTKGPLQVRLRSIQKELGQLVEPTARPSIKKPRSPLTPAEQIKKNNEREIAKFGAKINKNLVTREYLQTNQASIAPISSHFEGRK